MTNETEELHKRTADGLKLGMDIELMLRRYDPAVRGAALAQALAYWLLSHQEHERASVLDFHIERVRSMLKALEQVKR